MTVLLVEQKLPFARRVATTSAFSTRDAWWLRRSDRGLTDEVVREHFTVLTGS